MSQLRLCIAQRLLGLLPLDELPDLAADGDHHLEQVSVGRPYLVAEELHDAQDFAAEQDGEGERGVQYFARGDGRAREISIMDDIGNVCGLTAGPDSPRQAYPGLERAVADGGFEFADLNGFFMPHLHVAQHAPLAVGAPQGAHVPYQALAHGPKYSGSCFFESRRLRQYLGDGVLRHAAMLASLALGDVLHSAEHAAGSARLVSHHIAHTADE